MRKEIKIVLGVGMFLGCMLVSFQETHAASEGLLVAPSLQEVLLDANEQEALFFFDVTNKSDVSLTLALSVVDFDSLDASGGVAFLGNTSGPERDYALASWMYLERDKLTLKPGEATKVSVVVMNKESLAPGGHYGALRLKVVEGQDDHLPGEVAFFQELAALVFVKKLGGEKYGLVLNQAEIEKNFFRVSKTVTLTFKNTGNVHVAPRGIVTIVDPFGRTVKKAVINAESALLLPESERQYRVLLSSLGWAWLPGYYRTTVQYRYDGLEGFEEPIVSSFFFFPVYLLCIPPIGFILWRKRGYFHERAGRGTVGGRGIS